MNLFTGNMPRMLFGLLALTVIDSLQAAVTLEVAEPQRNRSAAIYQFDVYARNDMPNPIVVLSFDLPFDLGADGLYSSGTDAGFSFAGFSAAGTTDSDGEFSTSNVSPQGNFWDILVSATATGSDRGLPLDPGERKKLFSIDVESDGTSVGEALVASLILDGIGAQFGRFNVDDRGRNIYGSGLDFNGDGFALTAVPEPTGPSLMCLCAATLLLHRRRT